MKAHLLFEAADFDFNADVPAHWSDVVQDLGLGVLFATMAAGDRYLFDVAQRVVLRGLDDPEQIRYRQEVLADCVKEPEVVRAMYRVVVSALDNKRRFWGYGSSRPTSILAGALRYIDEYVAPLRELRKIADEHADRFVSRGFTELFRELRAELDDDYLASVESHLSRLRFGDGLLLSAALADDNSGEKYVLRSYERERWSWRHRFGLDRRDSYGFSIHPRDEAGANQLEDIRNRGVNGIANAVAQSADHISDYFAMLRGELGFYVGCLNLVSAFRSDNKPLCVPTPETWEQRSLSCTGLVDAGLALCREGRLVGNDLDADQTNLVVITGANSGGKSTFLRSIGLAHIMMQCGMPVTAERFRASVPRHVFTHFVREEDPSMESGRLDEELGRMSRIADSLAPRDLLLFNESFSTTNEREGSEIARQIVEALRDSDVRVVFVTHQFSLAEAFERGDPSAVFLRAERGPDGKRTYRVVPGPALETSFGEDVYRQIDGWQPPVVPAGSAHPGPGESEPSR